jgi:hypothetical protein
MVEASRLVSPEARANEPHGLLKAVKSVLGSFARSYLLLFMTQRATTRCVDRILAIIKNLAIRTASPQPLYQHYQHSNTSVECWTFSMTSRKVIVFGPTGAVGSAAARTAEKLGAKVVLAMRDVEKPIPSLDTAKEKQGSFERVYADLTKPDTVRDAVNTTRAKYAFIYCAHGTPDYMKSTIKALKSAGIDLVVFLSSFTIQGDLKAIQPSEVIPYAHAQVEINLGEIFGANGFVAARPGSFASNTRQYKAGIEKGGVKIYMPDAKVDCIVPEDIGKVCGTVLAKGQQDEQRAIYLYGPELLSQTDCIRILAKVLGKNPKIEIIDEQDAYKMFIEERGAPASLAKYMIGRMGKNITEHSQVFGYPVREEQLSNVQKYSGRKATTFEEWVEQNKQMFVS